MTMNYVLQKVDLIMEDNTTSEKEKMVFLYNTLPSKDFNGQETGPQSQEQTPKFGQEDGPPQPVKGFEEVKAINVSKMLSI